MEKEVFDIIVIGGGPSGLFTTFYAGMRQCKVKIIESMPQLGGQLAALYPEKYIYDVAGFPKVKAQDLVDSLKEQAMHFNPSVVLGERVLQVHKQDEEFLLVTDKGIHYAKTIIITGGIGAFKPRKLEHPQAYLYEEKNLHYFVSDLERFRNKRVVIFGGGDSAVDWALMLEEIAERVTIIHRRDKFRAHESTVEQMKQSEKIEMFTSYELQDLVGESQLEKVVIYNKKEEREETIELDECIVNFGFVSNLGPIKEWGLELEKNSIVVNSKMETNIPGIYAAGDITTYPGKVKLIAVGFGEAPTAVNNAKAYIDPQAKLQPKHSTSMDFTQPAMATV